MPDTQTNQSPVDLINLYHPVGSYFIYNQSIPLQDLYNFLKNGTPLPNIFDPAEHFGGTWVNIFAPMTYTGSSRKDIFRPTYSQRTTIGYTADGHEAIAGTDTSPILGAGQEFMGYLTLDMLRHLDPSAGGDLDRTIFVHLSDSNTDLSVPLLLRLHDVVVSTSLYVFSSSNPLPHTEKFSNYPDDYNSMPVFNLNSNHCVLFSDNFDNTEIKEQVKQYFSEHPAWNGVSGIVPTESTYKLFRIWKRTA